MKLNLKSGQRLRHGYVNVDAFPANGAPPDLYRQGDIGDLNWLAEDGTVVEILASDCLEYLPGEQLKTVLSNWAGKLAKGGIVKILAPDCYAIAKSFSQGQFDLAEYSQMVFGSRQNGDCRQSVIDASTLLGLLSEVGLTVTLKRYEGVAIYVEAEKC